MNATSESEERTRLQAQPSLLSRCTALRPTQKRESLCFVALSRCLGQMAMFTTIGKNMLHLCAYHCTQHGTLDVSVPIKLNMHNKRHA